MTEIRSDDDREEHHRARRHPVLGPKAITTLWQEIAENFYPQRADFTIRRYVGEEFAEHLYSSYPILVHRDLSNNFAAMLRPRKQEWFEIEVEEMDKVSRAGKIWLDWAKKRMRSAMYDRRAQFIRATSEGDADFAAFGQCIITRDINWNAPTPHLLYRCFHLRDSAWAEGADGTLTEIYFKWEPRISQLKERFGEDKLSDKLVGPGVSKQKGNDLRKVKCMRCVLSTSVYAGKMDQFKTVPYVIVYIDKENNEIIDEYCVFSHGTTVPRWQTVSGSQYAYSPATVAGLPDARLLQAMSLTLLEAGKCRSGLR